MSDFETAPIPAEYYITGGTLSANSASYVVRQSDSELIQSLLNGDFCYVLNSRQMGKSSLMVRTIGHLITKGITTAVLDLTAFGQNLTIHQWYLGLLNRLGQQLDVEDEIDDFWDRNDQFSPMQRWLEALTQIVIPHVSGPSNSLQQTSGVESTAQRAHSLAPKLVIFIDEIDVVRSLSFSTDEFFAAIRYCQSGRTTDPRLAGICFCLIGVATPSDLISNPLSSPFNIGKRIQIGDFTALEATPLANGLIPLQCERISDALGETRKTAGRTILDRVLYWTGGHPYLTQKLCRGIAEKGLSGAVADGVDVTVDEICAELFLSHRARESDDNLAFVRNSMVRSNVDLAALFSLYQQILNGETAIYDDTDPICPALRLTGLAGVHSNGHFFVRNRIYQRVFDESWISQYRPRIQDSGIAGKENEASDLRQDAEARSPLGNLPLDLKSFVGRSTEIAQIAMLVKQSRLVTLTGAGGTGKSRLSIRVAHDVQAEFPDGVWFVELASITDPGLVVRAITSVLGIVEESGSTILQTLISAIKEKNLLIVFDNCEHLLTACANVTNTVLHACSKVRILASSREAMRIPGEDVFRVPPLSLPPAEEALAVEQLNEYEATRLFLDRATSAEPSFSPTEEDIPPLISICRQLDGIPLAIELAAARVRSLTVSEIEDRLSDRFRLLVGGARTLLPRQQTLRALIDWSYQLLDEKERTLLSRLSVFAGGWTLSAAEVVCSGECVDDWAIMDLTTSLVDKSLLYAETTGQTTRYRMLETVREYACQRLRETGVRDIALRHARYFLTFAEKRLADIRTPVEATALRELEMNLDNLRSAMTAAQDSGDTELTARLGLACGKVRFRSGYIADALQLVQAALEAVRGYEADHAGLTAELVLERAWLCLGNDDLAGVAAMTTHAMDLFTRSGDCRGQARAANLLGCIAGMSHRFLDARAYFQNALHWIGSVNDQTELGNIYNTFGIMVSNDPIGNQEEASEYFQRAMDMRRELGDRRGLAESLNNIGIVAYLRGDWEGAWRYYSEALDHQRAIGDTFAIAVSLFNLAEVTLQRGEMLRTLRLASGSERLMEKVNSSQIALASDLRRRAATEINDAALVAEVYRQACSHRDSALIDWALQ